MDDVVRELLQCLGNDGDTTIPWEQVRHWPKGAMDAFLGAGWLKPEDLAEAVICPGCEENCSMPVEVFPSDGEQPIRAFIVCEYRNFGRVKISPTLLQQWQFSQGQLARWIADILALRFSGKRLDGGNLMEIGIVRGRKRIQMLCLKTDAELMLAAGSNHIPLRDAFHFIDGILTLDTDLIRQLVDTSNSADARYTPGAARREVRKQETEAMRELWQKAYRKLKKDRPNRSDVWYAQQIAKMDIAQGRDSETIRKQLKK